MNHEPRSIIDSQLTFNICSLLIESFANYSNSLLNEEVRRSLYDESPRKTLTKLKKNTSILIDFSNKNSIRNGTSMIVLKNFKEKYFNGDGSREIIQRFIRLLYKN